MTGRAVNGHDGQRSPMIDRNPMPMKAFFHRLDQRPRRERLQLLMIIVLVIGAVWYRSVWLPFDRSLTEIKAQRSRHQQGRTLRDRERDLEKKLRKASRDLLGPGDLPTLLHTMMDTGPGLKLLTLETEPPVPVPICTTTPTAPLLNHQTVTLGLQGRFPQTLNHLMRLEKSPWRLQWQSLTHDVVDYPVAEMGVRLEVLRFENRPF